MGITCVCMCVWQHGHNRGLARHEANSNRDGEGGEVMVPHLSRTEMVSLCVVSGSVYVFKGFST